MKKQECDIVKDLMPSYVDNICSEASRLWIEEHMADCEECRRTLKLLKNTEISAKRLEVEQLDAARKVVRQNLHRSMAGFGLCLVMTVLMLFVFSSDNNMQIPLLALYVALPVCMAASWLAGRNQTKMRVLDKWDMVSLAGAVLAAGYGAGMMFYGFSCILKGEPVFQVPWEVTGPFLYKQMVAAAVLCFVVFLVQMVRTVKQGRTASVVVNVCLTGIFMMMSYCVQMGYMSELAQAVQTLWEATVRTLCVGGVGTVALAVADKRKRV
ncbi:MAG: zf-HC2 domain-containing protein [Lachnospiraceae bacterium]|nr:zf-HC2 domain-containing protein [Lachnospiraceae bacterium]